jgi:hypothetical protein
MTSFSISPFSLLVFAALAMMLACGSPPTGPNATLQAYSKALKKRDYGAAYELMSSRFRDEHSKEEFVRMMRDNTTEAADTASRLRATPVEIAITAQVHYGFGDELYLIREGGTWRMASNPIEFYSQATPRDALRSFVRAYRLKRWELMLRFVPNEYRERMDADKLRSQFEGESKEDVEVMMRVLEANMDEPITNKGDEARMPYGDSFEVQFRREDGLWKIHDIN